MTYLCCAVTGERIPCVIKGIYQPKTPKANSKLRLIEALGVECVVNIDELEGQGLDCFDSDTYISQVVQNSISIASAKGMNGQV